jgi:predicted CXXCH cytochrome family protein
MRILSLVILIVMLYLSDQKTESPHGPSLKVSCKTCHSSKGWQLDKEIYSFDHSKTKLPLAGIHKEVDCRQCHTSLVFSDAKTECIQCHKDIHQNSVGPDCSRCHTQVSWLVNNIAEIHRRSRFPLVGAHVTADCNQCHKSENLVRFDVAGVNCIDCHRQDYMATTNPNHLQSGISQDCIACHPLNSFQWTGFGFNHSVFPLTQGHSAVKCTDCHSNGNYTTAKPDCYSCHQQDFASAKNPNHVTAKISTVCQDCHTLAPGWSPTTFDHAIFPLKLGHSAPACIDCHTGGNYTTTPSDCYSCHQKDYLATTAPNHSASGYAKTCESCHTLAVGWKPATIDHSKFPLTLGHAGVACTDCHKTTNYASTSTDCYSCHQTDFNNSTNPNHKTLSFSTTCTQCHTTTPGWKPASYTQHDSQFFPIYSGRHRGTWANCSDCHTNTANYLLFDCIRCHSGVHKGSNYSNARCYSCHPRGTSG